MFAVTPSPSLLQATSNVEEQRSWAYRLLLFLNCWLTGRAFPRGNEAPSSVDQIARSVLWHHLLDVDPSIIRCLLDVDATALCQMFGSIFDVLDDNV